MVLGRTILAICLCTMALASSAQDAGRDRESAAVYMSPTGDDAADGGAPERALSGLQAAVDLAAAKFDAGYREVTVRVLPGRYMAQTAKTAGPGAGRRLAIVPAAGEGTAVFDGTSRAETWLTVPGRGGQPANLTVSGLHIVRYATAITLNGSRDRLDNAVSRVDILNNVFDAIGQADVRDKPSTAVVRLVNGDGNRIAGNRFVHYRNLQSCSLLHAIYVAHDSTGNMIENNQFEDGCGDAIRFRDMSGNNVVRDNVFEDAWQNAPVTDWYCDASSRSDCTKAGGECPSLDNRLTGNRMVARGRPEKGLTAEFGASDTRLCPMPARARRFTMQ